MKIKNKLTVLCVASLMLTAPDLHAEEKNCTTAFAYGEKKFNLTPGNNEQELRGWQMAVSSGSSFATPIYAGVKKNKLGTGTLAGILTVSYEGGLLKISYALLEGFSMSETSLYVTDDKKAPSTAPGQYATYHHAAPVSEISDNYEIDVSAYGDRDLHIAALAAVCGEPASPPEEECEKDSLSWVGAWQENTVYAAGNIVQYNGSSYINTCCKSIEGVEPVRDPAPVGCWDIMAARGATGPTGPTGIGGNPGATGPTGIRGAQGQTGNKGPDGDQGPRGMTGPDGNQGPTGLIGQPGEKGPTGDRGPRGMTGPTGKRGPDGFEGRPGVQGPTGLVGKQGAQGPTGMRGPIGPTGPAGSCTGASFEPFSTSASFSFSSAGQCYEGDFMVGLDATGQIICRDAGGACRTAFAFGATELDDILPTKLWGWQVSVSKGKTLTQSLYTNAAGNSLSKAVKVGELTVKYEGTKVAVTFTMTADVVMSATHVYVGEGNVATTLPGEYGNAHEGLNKAVIDSYEVNVSGEAASMNVVAQAVVCTKK